MVITQKNIKKESFIFAVCVFFYGFILAAILSWGQPQITNIIGSIIVATTLGFSIYSGKKWLSNQNPTKIFYKMPLASLYTSVIISALIEVYIMIWVFITNPGESGMAIIFWPIYSLAYIIGSMVASLIIATYLYAYKFWGKKTLLKWVAIILLALPYAFVIMDLIQKGMR
ncbi:MAG: hypothetical protein AABW73_04765 [Nanoarchaeota archaeon]